IFKSHLPICLLVLMGLDKTPPLPIQQPGNVTFNSLKQIMAHSLTGSIIFLFQVISLLSPRVDAGLWSAERFSSRSLPIRLNSFTSIRVSAL
ncbi:hypothetical protein L9F63_011149, partial [Diploptera punctata]